MSGSVLAESSTFQQPDHDFIDYSAIDNARAEQYNPDSYIYTETDAYVDDFSNFIDYSAADNARAEAYAPDDYVYEEPESYVQNDGTNSEYAGVMSDAEWEGSSDWKFNLSKYEKMNSKVSTDTLAGTWVAVWDIDKVRSNIKTAPYVNPNLKISRLEMVVIRPDGDAFEMGTCDGKGFEKITSDRNGLKTYSRSLSIINNKTLMLDQVVSKNVQLKPMYGYDYERSYDEKGTFKAKYIKVSDQYGPLGQLVQNWNTGSPEIKKDIYCGTIDRMNDGLDRVRVGSDDEMKFIMASSIDPIHPTHLISEPKYTGTGKGMINTELELCEGAYYFDSEEPEDKRFGFYIMNMTDGVIINGSANLSLPH